MKNFNNISVALFIFTVLASTAYSQSHGDTSSGVHCYKCHGDHYGDETFAQCLASSPTTCSPGQVCRIMYSRDWAVLPTIGCSSICYGSISSICPYGGHTAALNRCDKCCKDDACVNQITTQLLKDAPVICPKHCTLSHASECWKDVDVCAADQFCQLTVENHRQIRGNCVSKDRQSRCLIDRITHECRKDITSDQVSYVTSDCTIDCCTDNECVGQHLGGVYDNTATNTLPPTLPSTTTTATTAPTTPAPTTPAPTTVTTVATTMAAYSVYAQLQQECRDHLEPGICHDLKNTQDLCKSNGAGLHLDLCPETCGVCQAIKEANCHDTVLDGECVQLMANKDICNGSLALYTCPASCGLCDVLVEQKLVAIVAAKADSTTTQAATQPPETVPTQPATQPPQTTVPTTVMDPTAIGTRTQTADDSTTPFATGSSPIV